MEDTRFTAARRSRRTATLLVAAALFALPLAALTLLALPLFAGAATAPDDGPEGAAFAAAAAALRERQYAVAYGRFAARADAGDAAAALMALALVRNGPGLFGSEWSATPGQVARWTLLATQDLRLSAPLITAHDRGE